MLKKYYVFLFFALALFLKSNLLLAETSDATLLQILSDPRRYDQKSVRVIGWLHLQPYEDALYLHEEDYRHAIYANSIWVDATNDMRNHTEKLTDRYVVMEGLFSADNRGNLGVYSGTIRVIRRCEEWSSNNRVANPKPDVVMTSGDQ